MAVSSIIASVEKTKNELLAEIDNVSSKCIQHENFILGLGPKHAREKIELEQEKKEMERKLDETQKEEIRMSEETKTKLKTQLDELNSILDKIEQPVAGTMRMKSVSVPSCLVCKQPMGPQTKIMQCKNGHLVCKECKENPKSKVKTCPTCKSKIAGRATAMEQHLQSLFG